MPALLLVALQEAAHGGNEGLNPFSINTGLIFWTLLVFLILLGLLWKYGWPAILKSVEERERRIQQQLEEAERARAEAVRLLEEHKRTIAGARAEAQEIAAKAKSVAEKEREAVDLSIAAASKLIEANLDSEANRRLVTEYLASLEAGREQAR